MAQMSFALGAAHLGPDHAVADVAMLGNRSLAGRRREAGPTGSTVIFGVALEQRRTATRAPIPSLLLVMEQRAGPGGFRPRLAKDSILFGAQLASPFGVISGIGHFSLQICRQE